MSCCCAWKCHARAISLGLDIPEVPRCHLLREMIAIKTTFSQNVRLIWPSLLELLPQTSRNGS